MSLENPLFGSREGREEVLSAQTPEVSTKKPVEEVPVSRAAEKPNSDRVSRGVATPDRTNSGDLGDKRPIGFMPPEKKQSAPAEAPAAVQPEAKPDLKMKPEEPKPAEPDRSGEVRRFMRTADGLKEVPFGADISEAAAQPKPETAPAAPAVPAKPKTPTFTMPETPKKSFTELKNESQEDYDQLVDMIQTKVEDIKQGAADLASSAVERSGVADAYRISRDTSKAMYFGSKAALENVTRKALLFRSISNYGWFRLGSEKFVTAVNEKVADVKAKAEAVVAKGAKTILENLMARKEIQEYIARTNKANQEQFLLNVQKLMEAQKYFEQQQAEGKIGKFKLKIEGII